MRPEFAAALVTRWVRLYTLGLGDCARERRVAEITADLHDQIADGRDQGTGDQVIALAILSRMARGLPADVSWRGSHPDADRSLIALVLTTLTLLSLPLVAMQFSDEVAWGAFDFAAAGIFIMGGGLAVRAARQRAGDPVNLVAVGLAVATTLLLTWGNLAVGVIGEPDEPANAMYLGVAAIAILGSVAARMRPAGMARAMLATALATGLAAAIALVLGAHEVAGSSVGEVVALSGCFTGLYVTAALLFRHVGASGGQASDLFP